jgi:hypothetical protein
MWWFVLQGDRIGGKTERAGLKKHHMRDTALQFSPAMNNTIVLGRLNRNDVGAANSIFVCAKYQFLR